MEKRVYAKLESSGVTMRSMEVAGSAPVEEEDLKVESRKLKKKDVKEAMRQARLKKLAK